MLQLDVVRHKTPERVRQELWTGLLAYNLVRQSLLQSATAKRCPTRTLSFTATLQMLANQWLIAGTLLTTSQVRTRLRTLRLVTCGTHIVGNRPDRVEPRAITRRPSQHDLLTVPRHQSRQALVSGNIGK